MSAILVESHPATVLDRSGARRFVDELVIPAAEKFDRMGRIPSSFIQQAAAAGVWALAVPVAFGGSGVDMLTLGAVHEELGRGCSSLRSLATVQTMVCWTIARWGTQSQKQRWLQPLARGEMLASFCLSEPNAGTHTRALATTATRSDGGWRIEGKKCWITGAEIAELYLVFARTDSGVSAFLVPRSAGVEVAPIKDILGTRASMLAEVSFDDVLVSDDAEVGPRRFAPGFVMTAALDIGRYSVACGSVGITQACLDASVAYAACRRIGDSLVADFQLTQAKLADMVTSVEAGRALCERAGRLKDAGDPATVMATWVAKYFASRAAARAAADAVQIHGANGCTSRYPVARYYRDAKIMEIIEGSTELQQITIGEGAFRERAR